MAPARRRAWLKSAARAVDRVDSSASSSRPRSSDSSPTRGSLPSDAVSRATSASAGSWRSSVRARSRARSNMVLPSTWRRMLAESSRMMTALWAPRLSSGRSLGRSANGRAKIKGSAAATPVRASSSRIWRSRRRADTRRSDRNSSCMAAKRTGVARRLPIRWISQGRPAASRPSRMEGARNPIAQLTAAPGASR